MSGFDISPHVPRQKRNKRNIRNKPRKMAAFRTQTLRMAQIPSATLARQTQQTWEMLRILSATPPLSATEIVQ
jgi:hypothetical protein